MKKAVILLSFLSGIVTIQAQNVGIGTATPASSAQLDVSSTTKGFLPPRMTSVQMISIATPQEGLIIYNTTLKKPLYYNGNDWVTFNDGASASIGIPYQGGIIAYVLKPGDPGFILGQFHGLISASSDQSTGAEWGCDGIAIPGADGLALGTGNQNTIDIIAGCVTAGIAAKICGDLVLNTYSDWYLPSRDELNILYINREAIGGFTTGYYWSSSENGTDYGWYENFSFGGQGGIGKNTLNRVRAIRAF